jgi:hypothetical protein
MTKIGTVGISPITAEAKIGADDCWPLSLLRPMLQDIRERHGIKAMLSNFGQPHLSAYNLFPAALLCLFLLMLWMSIDWSFGQSVR